MDSSDALSRSRYRERRLNKTCTWTFWPLAGVCCRRI